MIWFILGLVLGLVSMFVLEEVRFMLRIAKAMNELEAEVNGTIAALE